MIEERLYYPCQLSEHLLVRFRNFPLRQTHRFKNKCYIEWKSYHKSVMYKSAILANALPICLTAVLKSSYLNPV